MLLSVHGLICLFLVSISIFLSGKIMFNQNELIISSIIYFTIIIVSRWVDNDSNRTNILIGNHLYYIILILYPYIIGNRYNSSFTEISSELLLCLLFGNLISFVLLTPKEG